MKTKFFSALVLLAAAFANSYFSPTLAAGASEESTLTRYQGKPMMLRNSYCGRNLKFDQDGNLLSGGKSGSWTMCRDIVITEIQKATHVDRNETRLKLKGRRIHWYYDSKTSSFRDLTESPAAKKSDAYQEMLKPQVVSIEVQLPAQADDAAAEAALDALFYKSEEDFAKSVPEVWRCFFHTEPNATICGSEGSIVGQIMPLKQGESIRGTKPPQPILAPSPDYPSEIMRAGFHGAVLLTTTVGTDGHVTDIRITRPLGLGIDELAAAKVSKWKFKPAVREGEPVAVRVAIETALNVW